MVTLEQARALDALARHGTFSAAAAALGRGHTAILYALRTLEEALGFAVVDRGGYRTRLTAAGRRVLAGCRELLAAEARFIAAVDELRGGWEPSLTVVFDGIVPIDALLRAVGRLAAERAPTRVDVRAEFLGGVEEAFWRMEADLMIAVLPARAEGLLGQPLPAVRASLVAHRRHPLAVGAQTAEALGRAVLVTVRGSDPRLELPTAHLETASTVHLNDFMAKKAAILAGIGFGWMPDALIAAELARGTLRRIRWRRRSTHVFHPRLYHHPRPLGRAARHLVAAL